MGPVIEPPDGKLARALTELDAGERWLVEPEQLDGSGRLWSPGMKEGVAPGSFFHRTECFGPVLGIMRADTLEEAIELQNATAFGLTGGLHSLDDDEIERWLEAVQVGNAYVNRHITGAIVQRQPFGGWKDSVVGPGAKAGGPDYVAQLGSWVPEALPVLQAEPSPEVRRLLDALGGLVEVDEDRAWLEAAAGSDEAAWKIELGRAIDRTGLVAEENVHRYRALPAITVRAGAGATAVELVRVLLAAERAGTPAQVSIDPALSAEWRKLAGWSGLAPLVEAIESAEEFVARVRSGGAANRVRVLGDEAESLPGALAGLADRNIAVLAGPVLATGRRELLTMLREQAVSRTRHRFGHLAPQRSSESR
jgi:RHH-type proline utilization regulon transcriptional repressor/proline dehydrogenase/delta 1-pyrroline-5-carboxylate dehydrogenase